MGALLLAPSFFTLLAQNVFLCYYIQPEITFGCQSGGNTPALRPEIRLSRIGSFVQTPTMAIEFIQEATPRRRWRRSIQSGLLVRLRRRAHHPTLPNILLSNVQSLDNKVDELRARISFQRHIRDCNILFHGVMALSGYTVPVHTASWVLSTLQRQE